MENKTRKQLRAEIAELATKAFKDHKLTAEQNRGPVRMWYCGKPKTSIYSFRVIAAPRMLSVYGDIGDGMLTIYDKDPIPWLRGSVNSDDYVISKMTEVFRREVFIPGEVESMFDNMLKCAGYDATLTGREAKHQEEDKYIIKARRIIEETKDNWQKDLDDKSGHEFCRAFYEAGGETSYLSQVFDYDCATLWTLACLKKFVELLGN